MERNLKELISQMTLEEKAGMCSGLDFWHLKGVERLGIPSVMVSDGPHGLRKQDDKADHLGINDSIKAVCFPPAVLSACSYDRKLLEKLGEVVGDEAQAKNLSVVLGPAVNIKRSRFVEETLSIIPRIHILQEKQLLHLLMECSPDMLEHQSSILQQITRNSTV